MWHSSSRHVHMAVAHHATHHNTGGSKTRCAVRNTHTQLRPRPQDTVYVPYETPDCSLPLPIGCRKYGSGIPGAAGRHCDDPSGRASLRAQGARGCLVVPSGRRCFLGTARAATNKYPHPTPPHARTSRPERAPPPPPHHAPMRTARRRWWWRRRRDMQSTQPSTGRGASHQCHRRRLARRGCRHPHRRGGAHPIPATSSSPSSLPSSSATYHHPHA